MGANCRAVGWDFYGADGEPVLDPYGNPKAAKAPANAAAARKQKATSKRKRDQARKRMSRKIVGRAASQGPVTVSLAGITTRPGADRDRPAHHDRPARRGDDGRHARAGARAVG